MRLVCVTPFVPHADASHAGAVLLHHRLDVYARHVEVVVLAPKTSTNAAAAAASPGRRVVLLPRDAAPAGRRGTARALAHAALGRLDASVATISTAVAARAPELLRAGDAVELHWGEYLPLLPVLRRSAVPVRTGAFLHDIVSQARSCRAANRLVWTPERIAFAVGARALQRAERRLLRDADVVLVLKEQDRVALGRPPGTVLVAQPWLDLPEPAPVPAADPVVLMVSAFWREENVAGALWLLDHVWPLVREQVPAAELRLVGDRPAAVLQERSGREGVVVTGFVDDVAAEHRRSRVVVAPLTTATGLKVKVPQAMAYGLPVVARPAAAAGIADAPPDVLAGCTDDPVTFAGAVVAALQDRCRAAAVGTRARRWVAGRYDAAADVERALAAYAAVTLR